MVRLAPCWEVGKQKKCKLDSSPSCPPELVQGGHEALSRHSGPCQTQLVPVYRVLGPDEGGLPAALPLLRAGELYPHWTGGLGARTVCSILPVHLAESLLD